MTRRSLVAQLALPLLFALSGCVTYQQTNVNEPLDDDLIAGLPAGTDLQVCLDQLGAPIRVWQTEHGKFAIAYGWIWTRGWGVSAAYPIAPFVNPSLRLADDVRKLRGGVLWFDEDMKLLEAKTGLLSDLLPGRRRPDDVDLLDESAK
ncbi:MAG: hypothetical protein V3T86_00825 [Planctomycetota bacterium]